MVSTFLEPTLSLTTNRIVVGVGDTLTMTYGDGLRFLDMGRATYKAFFKHSLKAQ